MDTADGRLDDWFEARPPETKQDNRLLNDLGYEHFRYYLSARLARNILYSSNRVPLNWQSPEIRAFRGNDGVVWRQENPLTEPSAGLFLYSQFPGRKEWHLAAFLSQNLPLTAGVPARFTLTLKPLRPDQVPAEKAATIRTGALTLAKDDASLTCVTHPDYAFTLARHGGGIARMQNAKGETLLRDWEIESQGGYSRRISSGGDLFDGMMIFQDEKFLRIRRAAFPRNPGRSVLLTGLASLVEYAFPLEGGGPLFGSYQLMRRGSMPKKGGRIVLRGELAGRKRMRHRSGSSPRICPGNSPAWNVTRQPCACRCWRRENSSPPTAGTASPPWPSPPERCRKISLRRSFSKAVSPCRSRRNAKPSTTSPWPELCSTRREPWSIPCRG
ncbi:MAG: hypothetical protein L6W00_11450 [Lentisphaeria bacterium]|nr:MAG: hypothetical protein L6W00_11450 [Lentisphaeria bacterium]